MLTSQRPAEEADTFWNGFTYRQNKKRDTWVSWKCTQPNCRATLCTRDDIPSKIGEPHNHLPNQAAVIGRRILSTIRSRAKEELTPLPSIYDDEITKLRDALYGMPRQEKQHQSYQPSTRPKFTGPDKRCYHQYQLPDPTLTQREKFRETIS